MSLFDKVEMELQDVFEYGRLVDVEQEAGRRMIMLDKNENFFLPREYVQNIVTRCACELDLRRYLPNREERLKEVLASFLDVSPSSLVVGNGCDEVIDFVARAFARMGETAVITSPTFDMYRWSVDRQSCKIVDIPLLEDFSLNVDAVKGSDARIIFLCSPNNPTGNQIALDEIQSIAEASQRLVVVDETYVDFADYSCIALLGEVDNIVILRSLSKLGLASLRLGYAVTTNRVSSIIQRFVKPYQTSPLILKVVQEILLDYEPVRRAIASTKRERDRFMTELESIRGIKTYPSKGNFILIKFEGDAEAVHNRLLEYGVVVKSLNNIPRLRGHLRVTVGTPDMNDVFIQALKRILGDEAIG